MTGAGVMGTVCTDFVGRLVSGDLAQQFGEHGSITNPATGDLNRPDFKRIRINPQIDLAALPRLGRPVFRGQTSPLRPRI